MARREGHSFSKKHGFTGSAGMSAVRPHLRNGGQTRKHDDVAADAALVRKLVKPGSLKKRP